MFILSHLKVLKFKLKIDIFTTLFTIKSWLWLCVVSLNVHKVTGKSSQLTFNGTGFSGMRELKKETTVDQKTDQAEGVRVGFCSGGWVLLLLESLFSLGTASLFTFSAACSGWAGGAGWNDKYCYNIALVISIIAFFYI